jgi:hypothetical protein
MTGWGWGKGRARAVAFAASAVLGAPLLGRAVLESSTRQRTVVRAEGDVDTIARSDTDRVHVESAAPTRLSMRNVDFHLADSVVLRIRSLDGELHAVRRGVVDLDDKTSYVTFVDTAVVGLTGQDITNLLNRHVFAYRGAPLRHLKVEIRGDELVLSGTLHKGVDIPFTIAARPSLTANRRIRLHPTRIRIFGINGMRLMSALGLDLHKMLDLSRAKGIAVEGNDLLLAPLIVLPPPAIQGQIVALRIEDGELVQVFGARDGTGAVSRAPLTPPDSSARNFMFYRGGTLHFGKLYMTDAELLIMDQDESNAFDFDNEHYQRQLVSGHSRTLPDLGLEVYMPDARNAAGGQTRRPRS